MVPEWMFSLGHKKHVFYSGFQLEPLLVSEWIFILVSEWIFMLVSEWTFMLVSEWVFIWVSEWIVVFGFRIASYVTGWSPNRFSDGVSWARL